MKKLILSFAALATAALAFTSCEDVPMPYDYPNNEEKTDTITGNALPYSDINLKDWKAVTPEGSAWSLGNSYAKASGYDYNTKETSATEAWLVSPEITLNTTEGAILNFDYVIRYTRSDNDLNNHKVFITDNYTGDVATTTWTELGFKPAASADNTWTFYPSNTIQLPKEMLGKKVVIAFKFTCGSENSTTWELQNLSVKEGTAGDEPSPQPPTPSTLNTAETAWTVAEAIQKINDNGGDALSGEAYVKGIISNVDFYNEKYHSISYYISDDGSENNQLQIYSGKGLDGADFNSKDDLKAGQTVVVLGKLKSYNGSPEMDRTSKIVSISDAPAANTGLKASFKDSPDGFTINDITLPDGLTYVWKHDVSGYMKASAYAKRKSFAAQSRIVSPAFSLEGLTKATLTFEQTGKHFGTMEDECKVFASTDGNTWTELTINGWPTGKDWTFVTSTCDMSSFAGKSTVYIAFQYTSTEKDAPTWEVKNVVVK